MLISSIGFDLCLSTPVRSYHSTQFTYLHSFWKGFLQLTSTHDKMLEPETDICPT